MLTQVILCIALAASVVFLVVDVRRIRRDQRQLREQAAELRRLRTQNAEMQQLVADAAAQATLDSEAAGELLAHLQSMRAENAALKGKM